MKLSSSTTSSFLVYGTTYLILLVVGILLHFVSLPWVPSVLSRVYMIDLVLTCLLFLLGNFLFLSNNIYDLHWPLLPLICAIYFPWATHSIDHLSVKHILLTALVFLWSFHLIWQTIASSEDITHEDWRYQQMRQEYKNHFLLFAFVALHILPMLEVLLGSSALYYVYMARSRDEQVTLLDAVLLAFILLGVILENVADRQLKEFRQRKKRSRDLRFSVLSTGLWKYSRHPNYLGEMIFWWGLFFFGYIHDAPVWCALGPLFITLMMIFGSIPMSEERMFRKYPEYKFVQTDIPMLVPTFRFTEWICQRAFVRLFFRYMIKICRFRPFSARRHKTRSTIIRTYIYRIASSHCQCTGRPMPRTSALANEATSEDVLRATKTSQSSLGPILLDYHLRIHNVVMYRWHMTAFDIYLAVDRCSLPMMIEDDGKDPCDL